MLDFYPKLRTPQYALRFESIFSGGAPIIFSSYIHKTFFSNKISDENNRIQHTTISAIPAKIEGEFLALISVEDVTVLTERVNDYRAIQKKAFKEIEERIAAEELLKRKTAENDLLLDNINTQIWFLKDPETYGAINKAMANFLGVQKSLVQGKKILTITPDKDDARISIKNNMAVFEIKTQISTDEWRRNAKMKGDY